jgi:hypothetical protein
MATRTEPEICVFTAFSDGPEECLVAEMLLDSFEPPVRNFNELGSA